jgi:hypothetical protein
MRWIEEGTIEDGTRKYLGRCFKVAHGNAGGRVVKVVDLETYAGLLVPICTTIQKTGDAKHVRFEKREAIHPGRLR